MPEIISRKEARALGLKRYFTGVPCKYGHVCERYVRKATCTVCENEKTKRQHARRAARDPSWRPRTGAQQYAKHREKRKVEMKVHSSKRAAAVLALIELGLIKSRKRAATAPDHHIKRRSALKRMAEEPELIKERKRQHARKSYWKNPEACRARHRRYEQEKTLAIRSLTELGIEV